MPPPSARPKPDSTAGDTLRFKVDGATYTVTRSELTSRLERELFLQSGLTRDQAMQATVNGALFGVAALVFLAKRQAGEPAQYVAIEAALDAANSAGDLELELLADNGGDDSPPA
jgi:hypothetical protein